MTIAKSLAKANTRIEELDDLTDENCLLATPWVIGFDLKSKQWGSVSPPLPPGLVISTFQLTFDDSPLQR